MSECTLYRDVNFGGAQLTLSAADCELSRQGFNDATSSAKVSESSTPWIFYTNTNFGGNSYIVKPGDYPNADTWGGESDSLSSLRPLPSASEGDGVIALFENTNYGGRMIVLTQSCPSFVPLGFNDQASSLIVIKGTWTVYVNTEYNEDAGTFPAGTYNANLGPNDAISSAKLN